MIAEIAFSQSTLDIWADRVLTASWQGGLLLALAWMICKCWRQIPANTRCWIWRVAYFKFAVVLLFGGLLQLPVLPVRIANEKPVVASIPIKETSQAVNALTRPTIDRTVYEQTARSIDQLAHTATPIPLNIVEQAPNPTGWRSAIYATLFGFWIIGCMVSLVILFRHHLLAKRMVANGRPFENEQFERRYRILCAQLKLSRVPRLAATIHVKSPILVGAFRSTILIPESVIRSCGPDELGLIVAHELAHAKRRDLLWNWLPVLVRTFFFFHPLVWLVQSRFALDQEIASDQLALSCTRAQHKKYGSLLVKVSSSASLHCTPSLVTLGVASSFKSLKSRILEMHQFKNQTSLITQLLSIAIVAIGLLFVTPIELVAQQEKSARKIVKEKSIDDTRDSDGKLSRSVDSASIEIDEDDTKAQDGKKSGRTGSISISVSDGDVDESMQVKWKKSGGVNVTFTSTVDGEKDVKKYNLDDIEKLSKKNEKAYKFYKKHIKEAQMDSGGKGMSFSTEVESRGISGRSGGIRRSIIRSSDPAAEQSSESSSDSSSSSARQSSRSVGRNGTTRTIERSSTTGDGRVGRGANGNQQTIDKINKIMQQTDNAEMKQALQGLLDDLQKKGRGR